MTTDPRIFIACTGAGAGAQQEIWRVPGCSSYFAGACFPYGEDQLEDFIGYRPERFCCPDTALEMAMMAYYRAAVPGRPAIGVGLSAAVASTRYRRGGHRIHGAIVTDAGAWHVCEPLPKGMGERERKHDGGVADGVVRGLLDCVTSERWKDHGATDQTAQACRLLLSRPLWLPTERRVPISELPPGPLFPGAFNPPHVGHFGIAAETGATFHITVNPPHKPALSIGEILRRAKLLRGHRRLFTEGDALYLDKARRFPNRLIVIGADALLRALDPKWGPDPLPMICEFSELGTTLLVVGREVDGRFMTAHDVLDAACVPPDLREGFADVEGRWDLSSTGLRESVNSAHPG